MVEFEQLSIDDVDAACRALDAWQDAERKMIENQRRRK